MSLVIGEIKRELCLFFGLSVNFICLLLILFMEMIYTADGRLVHVLYDFVT